MQISVWENPIHSCESKEYVTTKHSSIRKVFLFNILEDYFEKAQFLVVTTAATPVSFWHRIGLKGIRPLGGRDVLAP
jgi:hypothetical protein